MMKRAVDFVMSLLGLVILSPFFAVIALLVKIHDRGPVFFVQTRVGQGGRPFRMFKFRSMTMGSDKGAALTVGQDPRITPVGHFLRRGKIDELPQLINVLRGEMSLVGPRPEIEKFVACYSTDQREVLRLKPGITDPASFAFFDESDLLSQVADPERFYQDQLMGEKIRINLDYAERANLLTDTLLILATVGRMFGVKLNVFSWLKIELPKVKA
jgi:lipopolysaccharide/colanic/teichoic acid biosynthesis glycosyltransferase